MAQDDYGRGGRGFEGRGGGSGGPNVGGPSGGGYGGNVSGYGRGGSEDFGPGRNRAMAASMTPKIAGAVSTEEASTASREPTVARRARPKRIPPFG
jgi:hypothetical protein